MIYKDSSLSQYLDDIYNINLKNASLNAALFKWNAGLLEPSISATVDVTKAYVDASLNLHTDFTYSTMQDASIAHLDLYKAEITYVDSSINKFATNASVNTAFALAVDLYPYPGGAARAIPGLKNASAGDGAMFKKDASIYLKINNIWCHWACTSTNFG
jgi:uncharacterized protein YjbI with pentapeptide repeats